MAWRVAKSLETLRLQLNKAFPKRSKVSDGGIGDAAHATRDSDHNPYITLTEGGKKIGIVRARDFTHDPATGIDCNWLAKQLAKHKDKRIRYIIWNRQICSATTQPWKWRKYTGSNAHTHHLHLSTTESVKQFDDPAEWKLDFPNTPANFADVAATVSSRPIEAETESDETDIYADLQPLSSQDTLTPAPDTKTQTERTGTSENGTTATSDTSENFNTQNVTKEHPSTFTRIITTIGGTIAAAIATITATCGGSEAAGIIANKSAERVASSEPTNWIPILGILVLIAVGLLFALGFFAIACWFYDRSRQSSNTLNQLKVEKASNPDMHTVEFYSKYNTGKGQPPTPGIHSA